jgi:hypothetical protein
MSGGVELRVLADRLGLSFEDLVLVLRGCRAA